MRPSFIWTYLMHNGRIHYSLGCLVVRPRKFTLYLRFHISFHTTSLANRTDPLSPKIFFFLSSTLILYFLSQIMKFLITLIKYAFFNHQYDENRSFALFFQCQNLIFLFIPTLKFAYRIMFVPQIFI